MQAVLTHKDVPGENLHGLVYRDWPVLCDTVVRYVGDAVAIVAADSEDIADQALTLIEVEYEPLPVVHAADLRWGRRRATPTKKSWMELVVAVAGAATFSAGASRLPVGGGVL